jgi:integrase
MTVLSVLDAAGRRRSPATLPGYHAGRPRRNKGMRYSADPPTVEEIVAVVPHAPDDRQGWRVRAMIVVIWRAGLRIHEALALAEHDLDHRRRSLLVRNGKGGRRREVGMDEWRWDHLRPWLKARVELPVGPLFCIIDGPTRGRPWSGAAVRRQEPAWAAAGARQADRRGCAGRSGRWRGSRSRCSRRGGRASGRAARSPTRCGAIGVPPTFRRGPASLGESGRAGGESDGISGVTPTADWDRRRGRHPRPGGRRVTLDGRSRRAC